MSAQGRDRVSGLARQTTGVPLHDDIRADHDEVHGVDLDRESRCAHYHGPFDIVAIKFKCCGAFYACKDCHAALADHAPSVWPEEEWHEKAIRCGACGSLQTIHDYLSGPVMCPGCGAGFNPRCRHHPHFYFATAVTERETAPGSVDDTHAEPRRRPSPPPRDA